MKALAIDVGTSSIRTAIVDTAGYVTHEHRRRLSLTTPNPGEVELDAVEIAQLALELATRTLDDASGADVVGITNQRATTIVFDPVTGAPVGPAIGWQDLRTVIDCLILQGDGLRLARISPPPRSDGSSTIRGARPRIFDSPRSRRGWRGT